MTGLTKDVPYSSLFPATPDIRVFSEIGSVGDALQHLLQAIQQREGVSLLIGPPGTGKSLLCAYLAESLKDDFRTILLAESQLTTRTALLQHILFHLGKPYRDLSEGELRLALIDHVTHGGRGGVCPPVMLILDEAQTLSIDLLEEVRMISNIVRDGQRRVCTILAGGVSLEQQLTSPELESLNQRIATRCYLHPLTPDETAHYIRHAFQRFGNDAPIAVDDEAIHSIHQTTLGVPRLINHLMRQTLAVAENPRSINFNDVDQAWSQQQQLPSPYLEFQNPSDDLPTEDDNVSALSEVTRDQEPQIRLAVLEPQPEINDDSILEFGQLSSEPMAESETVLNPSSDDKQGAPTDEPPNVSLENLEQTSPEIAEQLDRVTESLKQLAEEAVSDLEEDPKPESDTENEYPTYETYPQQDPNPQQETGERDAFTQIEIHAIESNDPLCEIYQNPPSPEDQPVQWFDEVPNVQEVAEVSETHESVEVCEFQNEAEIPAASAASLFGDGFDEEEFVPALSIRQENNPEPSSIKQNHSDAVQLDSYADGIELRADSFQVEYPDILEPETDADAITLRSFGAAQTGHIEPTTLDNHSPRDIHLNDDSDILVIEEAIEIEPSLEIGSAEQTSSPTKAIDHQTLIDRMRKG